MSLRTILSKINLYSSPIKKLKQCKEVSRKSFFNHLVFTLIPLGLTFYGVLLVLDKYNDAMLRSLPLMVGVFSFLAVIAAVFALKLEKIFFGRLKAIDPDLTESCGLKSYLGFALIFFNPLIYFVSTLGMLLLPAGSLKGRISSFLKTVLVVDCFVFSIILFSSLSYLKESRLLTQKPDSQHYLSKNVVRGAYFLAGPHTHAIAEVLLNLSNLESVYARVEIDQTPSEKIENYLDENKKVCGKTGFHTVHTLAGLIRLHNKQTQSQKKVNEKEKLVGQIVKVLDQCDKVSRADLEVMNPLWAFNHYHVLGAVLIDFSMSFVDRVVSAKLIKILDGKVLSFKDLDPEETQLLLGKLTESKFYGRHQADLD